MSVLPLPVAADEFDTLNGLIISLLDKIPADGETPQVTGYGYLFEVQRVKDKSIRRVRITKLAHPDGK